jgi:hypothetical protein
MIGETNENIAIQIYKFWTRLYASSLLQQTDDVYNAND